MVKHETKIAVIGGGLVGMAVAFGLRRRGRDFTLFDEGDHAFRAARGNFGLIWVQGKGATLPDYARYPLFVKGQAIVCVGNLYIVFVLSPLEYK